MEHVQRCRGKEAYSVRNTLGNETPAMEAKRTGASEPWLEGDPMARGSQNGSSLQPQRKASSHRGAQDVAPLQDVLEKEISRL